MKEVTQRRAARAAFLLACLLPTAATLGFCWWRQQPAWQEARREALGGLLHCRVELAGLDEPRPGLWRVRDLLLLHPETGAVLFAAEELHCQRGENGMTLLADAAVLEPDGLRWAWRRVRDALQNDLDQPLRLRVSRLTYRAAEDQPRRELAAVEAMLQPGGQLPHAYAAFRVDPAAEPALLRVVRNRRAQPPNTGIELQCPVPLSCGLAAPLGGDLPGLREAAFAGTLVCVFAEGGWTGEMRGTIEGVDLEGLAAAGFTQHEITGTARLQIGRAWARDGVLQQAAFTIDAGPGVVGRSLLLAARQHLGLEGPAEVDQPLVSYRLLRGRFELGPAGLSLAADSADGVLLDDEREALLRATGRPISLAALVRALSTAAAQIPSDRVAQRLLRHLPLGTTEVDRSGDGGGEGGDSETPHLHGAADPNR